MLLSYTCFADMPGNPGRHDVTLVLSGVHSLQPCILFIKDEYKDSLITVTADTSYIVTGSHGSPHNVMIFGESRDGKTDTIQFDEYGQQNGEIIFKGVSENKLQYTLNKASSSPAVTDTAANAASPKIAAAKPTAAYWLIGISISALVALIIFFVVRNQKKNKDTGV